MKITRTFILALSGLLAFGAGLPRGFAAFDPVGEDIDIFLANPAATTQRPNVLLMLDNTANWNQNYVIERSALVTVVNSLSDTFNVGLMMFNQSGQSPPDGENHGGFVRFGVRRMTTANKSALSTMASQLDGNGDSGSNNNLSELFHEAYLYWAGLTASLGYGQAKRDYAGNAAFNPLAANLPGSAFSSATSRTYISPIVDGCQKNFQIFISNGKPQETPTALADIQNKLALILKVPPGSPPPTIPVSNVSPDSSTQQANWVDEYARHMATGDCNALISGMQNVITYVVEIDPKVLGDPGFNDQDAGTTTVLKSAAVSGKGTYFKVSSANGGAEIVAALTQIFQEIQAKNTVFAATTLPVSVNVRGTNLNQVYIGVFRPDANKGPRWFGNLKLYNLQVDSATDTLFLADANGVGAADPSTGFTKNTAKSFWTTPSSFWSFRSPYESTDIGQQSDSPDGDLVEKGGVAERLRIAYATSQASRKLYTCTGSCAAGVALSDSPFETGNTNITAVALGTLLTKPVSSLTSSVTTATAVVTNHGFTGSPVVVIEGASPAIYNGTFPISVTDTNTFTYTLPSVPPPGTAIVLAPSHGLNTNDLVNVSSSTQGGYNVSGALVTKVDANNFSYVLSAAVTGASSGHTVVGSKQVMTLSAVGTTATVNLPSHGYTSPTSITIAGATPDEFNVTGAQIANIGTDTFTYTTPLFTGSSSTGRGTTTVPHNFNTGDTVTVNCVFPTDYNATGVATVIDATNFEYTLLTPQSVDASSVVTGLTGCSGATNAKVTRAGAGLKVTSMSTTDPATVTVNTDGTHPFRAGDAISISGVSPTLFEVTTTVTSQPTPTSLTYTLTIPAVQSALSPATGTIAATVGASTLNVGANGMTHGSGANADRVTVNTGSTSPPAAFVVGAAVVVAGANQSAYNGTFKITSVTITGPNRGFTYVTGALSNVPSPTVSGSTTVSGAISRDIVNTCGAGNSPCVRRAFVATETIFASRTVATTSITAQTNATGTITAASQTAPDPTARAALIEWVRGQDNAENENADASLTDVRASVHGDVLHSRPAIVNYNRGGDVGSNTGDNDVFAFYGGNDGVLRAVQGGFASNGGNEVWGFIAPEFFDKFKRLRRNKPLVGAASGTSGPRDYFFDGPIGVYTNDVNRDGKLLAPTDKVHLFVGMRRGGRYLYALDVSDPANPKFMWKRGCPNLTNNTGCDTGFEEIGQTWSEPKVGFLRAYTNPVLIFGGGYDPAVEDFQPCLVTASDDTRVTARTGGSVTFTSAGSCTHVGTTSTAVDRSMGRGVFIIDATNGNLLFRFGADVDANKQVTDMKYAIPADVVVLNRDGDGTRALPGRENIQSRLSGFIDRIYAVDTGGNVWRLDVDSANTALWVVTQLASLSGTSLTDKRKFLFPPDVVFGNDLDGNFDGVLVGSGDREHPFDATVTNRFYMLKDRKTGLNATGQAPRVDSTFDTTSNPNGLFDATDNCLQNTVLCPTGSLALANAQAALRAATGWKLTLGPGEKNTGTATTLAGSTFFNTNQPAGSAAGLDCSSNLGVARQYIVSYKDATATISQTGTSGALTTADRSVVALGGGYLPSSVPLIVEIGGKKYQAVISGTQIQSPGGLTFGARARTYWYRKLE